MTAMKTIVCEQPFQFAETETEVPTLTAGHALVRIRRIGICGTDIHAFRGEQPYFTYPRILGHELSGVIEEIGNNEHALKPGDQVTIIPYMQCGHCASCRNGKTNCCERLQVLGVHRDGGMRELLSVPVDHLLKTDGLTLDEAAVIEPLCIGAHAVRRSGVAPGEYALVIGAGPIGLGVIAFAAMQGAKVIAMDMNEDRLAFCRRWKGVVETIHAGHQPNERLAELTGGALPSVVFDATGNARSMVRAFDYVGHGGRLVLVGLVKDNIHFSDPDFHRKELTVLASRNATEDDFHTVTNALRTGQIQVDGYLSHRCHFDELTQKFDDWTQPQSGVIKAVVELS